MTKLDLNLGTQVCCTDQPCGKLVKLVVDPRPQQVIALIVEKRLLLKSDRVFPLAMIERVTDREIYLNLSSDAVSHYAEYQVVEVEELAPGADNYAYMAETNPKIGPIGTPAPPLVHKPVQQGIALGQIVIGKSTKVENLHKTLGHVDRVVVDPESGQIIDLVMRRGFLAEYLIIPAAQIQEISEEGVFIGLTNAEVAALPRYIPQPATEVVAELQDRLAWDERLHPTETPVFAGVNAIAEGGVLHLTGCVPSKAIQYHAEEHAQAIDGVIDVQNDLTVDPSIATAATEKQADLEMRICAALAADPRTQAAMIEVIVECSVVTLQGQVASSAQRDAAAETAILQPGVQAVINELVIASPRQA